MIKNNIKALGIHFLIMIFFTVLAWTSTEKILLYTSFSTFFIYFITGFLFLKPNIKNAFLSTSSVLVLTLASLILGFITGGLLMSGFNINPISWWLMNVWISIFGIKYSSFSIALAAFLPSIIIYSGILAKRYWLNRKEANQRI